MKVQLLHTSGRQQHRDGGMRPGPSYNGFGFCARVCAHSTSKGPDGRQRHEFSTIPPKPAAKLENQPRLQTQHDSNYACLSPKHQIRIGRVSAWRKPGCRVPIHDALVVADVVAAHLQCMQAHALPMRRIIYIYM